MTLDVLFFAQARERAGRARETIELPDGSLVRDALVAILKAHPTLDPLVPHLAIALDGRLAGGDAPLSAGAELALLPPVSGG